MVARGEALGGGLAQSTMRLPELPITEAATQAHQDVITAGMTHIDGADSCGGWGIAPNNVESCPYYQAASDAYTYLVLNGQRGAAH